MVASYIGGVHHLESFLFCFKQYIYKKKKEIIKQIVDSYTKKKKNAYSFMSIDDITSSINLAKNLFSTCIISAAQTLSE